jgi:hypothetical protein
VSKAERLNELTDRIDELDFQIDAGSEDRGVSDEQFQALIDARSKLYDARTAVLYPSDQKTSEPAPRPAPVVPQPVEAFSPEQVARRLEDAEARIEEAAEERAKFKPDTARYARAERAWIQALGERDGIKRTLLLHNAKLETEAAVAKKIDKDAREAVFAEYRGEIDKLTKQGADRYKLQDAIDRAIGAGQLLAVTMHSPGGGPLSSKPPSSIVGLSDDVQRRLEQKRPVVEAAVRQRIAAGNAELAASGKITRPTPPPPSAKPSGLQDDPRFGLRDNAGFFGGR